MIGFNYTYSSQQDIFTNMAHIWSMSVFDMIWVAAAISIVLLSTFVIIPGYIIVYRYIKDAKEKSNKKKLLSQILMQKEIEDEVEKEIHIENEWEVI